MKKIIFIIIAITFFSCRENKESHIIPNADVNYYSLSAVQQLPAFKNADYEKEISNAFAKEIGKRFKGKESKLFFDYFIYINKEGKVDFVKNNFTRDYIDKLEKKENYLIDIANTDAVVSNVAKEWTFEPAMKDGVPVNCKKRLSFEAVLKSSELAEIKLLQGFGTIKLNSEVYFVAVEKMPTLIGGLASIQKYIKYPESARRAGIEGRVFVKAFIDENGSVADAQLIKGIGGGCDSVALAAVKNAKFIPGSQKGKTVKVQVSIPILFKLK